MTIDPLEQGVHSGVGRAGAEEVIQVSIADDMVSGFQCSYCGTLFRGEHGYSVLCNSCFDREVSRQMKSKGFKGKADRESVAAKVMPQKAALPEI
jgi:hypothetical protein